MKPDQLLPPRQIASFRKRLLAWYAENRRDLPWRRSRDPYGILISEVMLQQTQVDTVIPYYNRFLKAFPTFQSLARAPIDRVLKLWEGLGYYSRARNLHNLAKVVVRDYAGRLPRQYDQLRALPGIGPYTAGALMSIAFNEDFAVVDGNVERVLARHVAWQHDLRSPAGRKQLWTLAQTLLAPARAGDFNQGLMELGATVCSPRAPRCKDCPVHDHCEGRKRNLLDVIPMKKQRVPLPHYNIGAGVIWKGNKILISQRPLEGLLGGLWEFPGGKQERGESLPSCVRRELKEELDITVKVRKRIATVEHAYSHFRITLHAYTCSFIYGKPKTLGCRAWKWVAPKDLKRYAFPAANQPIIRRILAANVTKGPRTS